VVKSKGAGRKGKVREVIGFLIGSKGARWGAGLARSRKKGGAAPQWEKKRVLTTVRDPRGGKWAGDGGSF